MLWDGGRWSGTLLGRYAEVGETLLNRVWNFFLRVFNFGGEETRLVR